VIVSVYIAVSLDGFIARKDGSVDWLEHESGAEDYGYRSFIETVDVLAMGRNTFDQVRSFDGNWPYQVPVVVVTRAMSEDDVPADLVGRVSVSARKPEALLRQLAERGAKHVYVDGGLLVQSFLHAGLVDRLILTRLPVLLGDGIPLFGPLDGDLRFEHATTKSFPSGLVQTEYRSLRHTQPAT